MRAARDIAPPATGGPYATPEELAAALNLRVTDDNRAQLTACLEAAASEIDDFLDRVEPLEVPAEAIVNRTNVNRAVEWWKAPDAANGGVGIDLTGVLKTPASGFERHAAVLLPDKERWGIA